MNFNRLFFLALISAAIAGAVRTYAFEGIYIASASMEPTLPVGRELFLDKITYLLRNPERGEVISFVCPVPPVKEMVKRVIAVGGDRVEIRDKEVFINGAKIEEFYVQHTRAHEKLIGDNLGPLEVPPNSVFVLGDNRDESNDSSIWKDPATDQRVYFLPKSAIRGIVRGRK